MNFNSIKVQLELNQATAHVKFISHFNSIKVQLERISCRSCGGNCANFNSIKVQLEPGCPIHPKLLS